MRQAIFGERPGLLALVMMAAAALGPGLPARAGDWLVGVVDYQGVSPFVPWAGTDLLRDGDLQSQVLECLPAGAQVRIDPALSNDRFYRVSCRRSGGTVEGYVRKHHVRIVPVDLPQEIAVTEVDLPAADGAQVVEVEIPREAPGAPPRPPGAPGAPELDRAGDSPPGSARAHIQSSLAELREALAAHLDEPGRSGSGPEGPAGGLRPPPGGPVPGDRSGAHAGHGRIGPYGPVGAGPWIWSDGPPPRAQDVPSRGLEREAASMNHLYRSLLARVSEDSTTAPRPVAAAPGLPAAVRHGPKVPDRSPPVPVAAAAPLSAPPRIEVVASPATQDLDQVRNLRETIEERLGHMQASGPLSGRQAREADEMMAALEKLVETDRLLSARVESMSKTLHDHERAIQELLRQVHMAGSERSERPSSARPSDGSPDGETRRLGDEVETLRRAVLQAVSTSMQMRSTARKVDAIEKAILEGKPEALAGYYTQISRAIDVRYPRLLSLPPRIVESAGADGRLGAHLVRTGSDGSSATPDTAPVGTMAGPSQHVRQPPAEGHGLDNRVARVEQRLTQLEEWLGRGYPGGPSAALHGSAAGDPVPGPGVLVPGMDQFSRTW
jgi:hypothetical protein